MFKLHNFASGSLIGKQQKILIIFHAQSTQNIFGLFTSQTERHLRQHIKHFIQRFYANISVINAAVVSKFGQTLYGNDFAAILPELIQSGSDFRRHKFHHRQYNKIKRLQFVRIGSIFKHILKLDAVAQKLHTYAVEECGIFSKIRTVDRPRFAPYCRYGHHYSRLCRGMTERSKKRKPRRAIVKVFIQMPPRD